MGAVREDVGEGHGVAVTGAEHHRAGPAGAEPQQVVGEHPAVEDLLEVWRKFRAVPQERQLPSAPQHPIVVREEPDRPQPKFDLNVEAGMAAVVGRARTCNVLQFKYTALSHNTVRGAAGAALLNAELMKSEGYLD